MQYLIFSLTIIAFITLLMISGWLQEKNRAKKFIQTLRTDYGILPKREYTAEEYENISHYFKRFSYCTEFKNGFFIDDITWHDLEMDEIFKRMNHTYSSAGEEYLYYLLRTPTSDTTELNRREELITFFQKNQNERVDWQYLFSRLGRTGKYSIYKYLGFLDHLGERSNAPHFLAILGFAAALLLTSVSTTWGIVALFGILAYNLLTYFRHKKDIEPYIICFTYVFRLLECIRRMEKQRLDILKEQIDEAVKCEASFQRFKRGSYLLMSPARLSGGNPIEAILDYLRMGFHLDLIKFNQMLKEVRKHSDKIDRMLTIMGQIEAMIAIGAWRESLRMNAGMVDITLNDACCTPQFTDNKQINCADIYHPLLTEPVKNDLIIRKSILLTGSNASGKSTFLKTIALNAIFAQSIHTCTAGKYQTGKFCVATSMSLKDNIIAGDSYYMVEIKSMKRLLNLPNKIRGINGVNVLVLVDEVLRGTNTVERIAASTQILRSLNSENSVCLAATHDIELTYLLAEEYDNYHFEEQFKEDIYFPYKILPGAATTRNAIKLLERMGYDEELVADAERLAKEFMESGKWV
jgi:hypothetical protein